MTRIDDAGITPAELHRLQFSAMEGTEGPVATEELSVPLVPAVWAAVVAQTLLRPCTRTQPAEGERPSTNIGRVLMKVSQTWLSTFHRQNPLLASNSTLALPSNSDLAFPSNCPCCSPFNSQILPCFTVGVGTNSMLPRVRLSCCSWGRRFRSIKKPRAKMVPRATMKAARPMAALAPELREGEVGVEGEGVLVGDGSIAS